MGDLAQLATLGVDDPQVGVSAAVGQKDDFVVARAGGGGEDMAGLPRHPEAAANVVGGLRPRSGISRCWSRGASGSPPPRRSRRHPDQVYDASPDVTASTRPSLMRTWRRRMFGKYGIVSPELEL